jgi:hypothetical protein
MQAPDILLTYLLGNQKASSVDFKAFYHLWYNANVVNGAQAFGSLHQDLTQIFVLPTCSSCEFTSKDSAQLVNSMYLKLLITTTLFVDVFNCLMMLELLIDILNYSLMLSFNLYNLIEKKLVI